MYVFKEDFDIYFQNAFQKIQFTIYQPLLIEPFRLSFS